MIQTHLQVGPTIEDEKPRFDHVTSLSTTNSGGYLQRFNTGSYDLISVCRPRSGDIVWRIDGSNVALVYRPAAGPSSAPARDPDHNTIVAARGSFVGYAIPQCMRHRNLALRLLMSIPNSEMHSIMKDCLGRDCTAMLQLEPPYYVSRHLLLTVSISSLLYLLCLQHAPEETASTLRAPWTGLPHARKPPCSCPCVGRLA